MITENNAVFTDDGRRVEPGSGEMGMVAVGGFIPVGYYKDEAKSAATFRTVDGPPLEHPRRLRHRQRGRLDPPPRARLGVHQHGRREGLPRGGRGGAEDAPVGARRRRRRHPRRALRRDDLRRRRGRRGRRHRRRRAARPRGRPSWPPTRRRATSSSSTRSAAPPTARSTTSASRASPSPSWPAADGRRRSDSHVCGCRQERVDALPVQLRRRAVVARAGRGEAVHGVGEEVDACTSMPAAFRASSMTRHVARPAPSGRRRTRRSRPRRVIGSSPRCGESVAVAHQPGAVDRRRRGDPVGHRPGERRSPARRSCRSRRRRPCRRAPPGRRRRRPAAPRRR